MCKGVSCDACLKNNFRGRRYKCLICYDYDLCAACYEQGVSNTRHTPDHPVQCLLTRAESEIYYGGETLASLDLPQSYTCPYCSRMGFTELTLQEHVTTEHQDSATFEVVCPLCAALPGGDPNLMTDDFASHLTLEHRPGHRDLISFMDEPGVTRHNVRRMPHSSTHTSVVPTGRGGASLRPRRSNMHFRGITEQAVDDIPSSGIINRASRSVIRGRGLAGLSGWGQGCRGINGSGSLGSQVGSAFQTGGSGSHENTEEEESERFRQFQLRRRSLLARGVPSFASPYNLPEDHESQSGASGGFENNEARGSRFSPRQFRLARRSVAREVQTESDAAFAFRYNLPESSGSQSGGHGNVVRRGAEAFSRQDFIRSRLRGQGVQTGSDPRFNLPVRQARRRSLVQGVQTESNSTASQYCQYNAPGDSGSQSGASGLTGVSLRQVLLFPRPGGGRAEDGQENEVVIREFRLEGSSEGGPLTMRDETFTSGHNLDPSYQPLLRQSAFNAFRNALYNPRPAIETSQGYPLPANSRASSLSSHYLGQFRDQSIVESDVRDDTSESSSDHEGESSGSGLSSLSPSSREGVDPIAELLSQLSGVRRSTSNSSNNTPTQLQQLQMQLQLERQQASAARQNLEPFPRRPHMSSQALRERHHNTSSILLNSSPVLVQPSNNTPPPSSSGGSTLLLTELLDEKDSNTISAEERFERACFVQELIWSTFLALLARVGQETSDDVLDRFMERGRQQLEDSGSASTSTAEEITKTNDGTSDKNDTKDEEKPTEET